MNKTSNIIEEQKNEEYKGFDEGEIIEIEENPSDILERKILFNQATQTNISLCEFSPAHNNLKCKL